jgi:hypothetical protein
MPTIGRSPSWFFLRRLVSLQLPSHTSEVAPEGIDENPPFRERHLPGGPRESAALEDSVAVQDLVARRRQRHFDPTPIFGIGLTVDEAALLEAGEHPRQRLGADSRCFGKLAGAGRGIAQRAEDAPLGQGQLRIAPEARLEGLGEDQDIDDGANDVPRFEEASADGARGRAGI